MRICDLKDKEVVNTKDGRILGCVFDVDFDMKTGCILAIVVPGPPRIWGFFGHDIDYVIPFKCICCVGPDTILVCVDVDDIIVKCG